MHTAKRAGTSREGAPPADVFRHDDSSEHNPQALAGQGDLPLTIAAIPKGDGEVRVSLDSFKSNLTIDVRLFERFGAANTLMPTKRGVTLGLARLPDLARALADAEAEARRRGLL